MLISLGLFTVISEMVHSDFPGIVHSDISLRAEQVLGVPWEGEQLQGLCSDSRCRNLYPHPVFHTCTGDEHSALGMGPGFH